MIFHEYEDAAQMAMALANLIRDDIKDVLDRQPRALLCVPGGTTPAPMFDHLSQADLDWSCIDVVLSDERWVPETHMRSNTRLLHERLFKAKAAAARYVPLYAPSDRPEEVINDLENRLADCLPISVLVLGMGADMHTASLFPGANGLETALSPNAPILVPIRTDQVDDTRITLSARVLNAASSKHLMITGDAKRKAVQDAQLQPALVAPVRAVMDDMVVHWAP